MKSFYSEYEDSYLRFISHVPYTLRYMTGSNSPRGLCSFVINTLNPIYKIIAEWHLTSRD